MRLFPLSIRHPKSGALRVVTPGLLAESYVAPRAPGWALSLDAVDAPWSASLTVAPTETAAAVERALRRLMLATPDLRPDIDLSRLAPSRARDHLQGLLRLWQGMGDALPDDLWPLRHVLETDEWLEPLPVIAQQDAHASVLERALMTRLIAHHGSLPHIATVPGHPGSLGHLQRHLLAAQVERRPNDGSLAFYGLRDAAQQGDFAAARAQVLIDAGAAPHDIAVLAPDEAVPHLARAFAAAGVPLTGLAPHPTRDLAGETLLHALLVLQPLPPGMARASLYVSALMPWPAATGDQLAREVMAGSRRIAARDLAGPAAKLHDVLRNGASSAAQLRFKLDVLAECLTDAAPMRAHVTALRGRIRAMQALMTDPLDWPALIRAASPGPASHADPLRMVQGVSLIPADQMPWREAKHLIVAGFAGDNYPVPASNDPFFLDSELASIAQATGLAIPGRAQHLNRALDLFQHQLSAASDSVTFLCPYRNGRGARLQPSTGLSLVARTVPVQVIDVAQAARWPCAQRVVPRRDTTLAVPETVALHRDLLALRRDNDNQPLPQSPSRLEKLLVSPLAWAIAETGAQATDWLPDEPDIMAKGSIAHEVLEHLFPAGPICGPDVIAPGVEQHFEPALRNHAPFMLAASWKLERESLRRDILRAAATWRDLLAAEGAEILATEIRLHGEGHGITMRGYADCILRLGDGQLLIVDHKSSGTQSRRDRMNAGWDLQLGLYRAMLMRPIRSEGDGLDAIPQGATLGVAYHLLRDSGVLLHGIALRDGSRMEAIPTDIGEQAIALLNTRIAEVGAGMIRMNTADDAELFQKTGKFTPYALSDSPMTAAFQTKDEK